jgi:copper(I)-binding protein
MSDRIGKPSSREFIMKTVRVIQAVVLAGLLTIGATVAAQPGMARYQQLYTTGEVQTVSGAVQSVYSATPPGVRTQAVYVSLKTDGDVIPVQLGPEWFIAKLATKIEKGDKIEVTGARVTVEGKSLMLAAQVKKGAETLVFRNDSGVPVWSGR